MRLIRFLHFLIPGTSEPVNVAATTQALVITEYPVSINIAVGTDALVITEQATTVTLGKVVEATSQALAITEFPVDQPLRMSSQALTITGQPATIGLSTDVQAGTDALVITEQAASVTLPVIKREYRTFYESRARRRYRYDSNPSQVQHRPEFADKRPEGRLEIDWTHPMTRGLAIVYFPQVGTDPYRLMYEKGPYKLGRATPTEQYPDKGRVSSRALDTRGYLEWDVDANHWINGAVRVTMAIAGRRPTAVASTFPNGGVMFHDSGNNGSRVGIGIDSSDNLDFQADNADNLGGTISNGALPPLYYQAEFFYNGDMPNPDRCFGFGKGEWVSLGANSKATSLLTTYDKFYINGYGFSAQVNGTTDLIDYAFVWDRQLKQEELESFRANPYQMFRQTLDLPMFAPPTSDLDLQAGSDSLVLSPQNADVNAENNANATTQALVITEYPANVQVGLNLHPTPQALTITEHKVARDVYAQSQALSITEHQVAQPLTVKRQNLTLTTYPALIPVNKNVDAQYQELSITTYHCGIYPRKVEATSQALTILEQSTGGMHSSAHTATITLTPNTQNVYNRGPDWIRGRTADVLSEDRKIDA